MKTVFESARETPVRHESQALVAGGGLTGVCAAIAAARAGARTLLVEHSHMLGGVATAGLMASFNNRFIAADGTQVVCGIPGEIVDRLVELRGARPDWRRPDLPHLPFDPELLQVVLIRLLRDASVHVLLGTTVAAARDENGVVAVILEGKAGREAALADVVVDATGEAVIAAHLGADCGETPPASASLEFRMAGVDLPAFFEHFRQHPEDFAEDYDLATEFEEFARNWSELGVFHLPHGGGVRMRPIQDAIARREYWKERGLAHGLDAFGFYATADTDTVIVNSNFYTLDSLDPSDLSNAIQDARERCIETADLLKRVMPGFEQAYVVATAPELGVRISRRIRGRATLTREQLQRGDTFEDVVAVQPRLHSIAHGERRVDGTSELPYGIMLPRDVARILVASGKTVSTEPRGVVRAMVSCMALGQAAGAAAALAGAAGASPSNVPIRRIQQELLDQGAYLGPEDRLAELGLK
ncbi:MAG: FAD-dependent oxidoreductase [Armatimonadota bacterium]|nr:MAG: FAD-dependent oxidoreductase [Armatimonadota bacterium]